MAVTEKIRGDEGKGKAKGKKGNEGRSEDGGETEREKEKMIRRMCLWR